MEGLLVDLYSEARARHGRSRAWWLAVRACAEIVPRAIRARTVVESPHGVGPVYRFLSDVLFAARAVVRRPRHTLVVVVTIAVGIGATTAVFSVLDAAILRPLPFPDDDRLVELTHRMPDLGFGIASLDTAMIGAWREQTQIFDRVEGATITNPVVEIDSRPHEMDGARASPGLFTMLGARALAGRLLLAEDAAPGAPPMALVSESLWERQFGAAESVGEAGISLDGVEHRVVGVLPDGFAFPRARTQVWTPVDATDPTLEDRLHTYARLRPGLSLAEAKSAAVGVAAGMSEANPRRTGWAIGLLGFQETRVRSQTRRALWLALGAAGMMLAIAVMNVAHVSLVQTIERRGELAIRAALGAGRGRLVRQVLLECLLTALAGGALGVGLAFWMVTGITRLAPEQLVTFDAVTLGLHWRGLLFALTVSAVTGIVAGLVPALSSARQRHGAHATSASPAVAGSRARRRFHATLVAVETGAALVLLAGAALLIHSFDGLVSLDPGFDPEGVVTVALQLDEERYQTPESRLAFLEQLAARARLLPGVEAAVPTGGSPPNPGGFGLDSTIAGEDGETLEGDYIIPYGTVAPGYFALAGVPILQGRDFTEDDYGTDTAIVSEDLARALWGESRAVGRRLSFGGETWYRVVGVAGRVWALGIDDDEDRFQMYYPIHSGRWPSSYVAVTVRTTESPSALAEPLREAVWEIDPAQPVYRVQLATDEVGEWYVEPRFYVVLMSTFAAAALLLSLVGLFGVVGHAVASRTREIGIRVALGADDTAILRLAIAGGLGPAIAGLLIGALGVWQARNLLESLFRGVSTDDPAILALACVAFLACTVLASYVPARRALRVSPVEALRSE